jgi:hypothetical protein
MTTYYVSQSTGSDASADPTNIATPWKTQAKVTSYAWATGFAAGDRVVYKRGDVWREQFYINNSVGGHLCNGTAGNHITFGAYGAGAKPIWSGAADLSATGAWADQGSNIWRSTGLTSDIGNLICDGETIVGFKRFSLETCTAQGDFWYSTASDYIEMYSVGNPGTFYSNIEAAQKWDTTSGGGGNILGNDHSYFTFRDIAIKYQGFHGLKLGNGTSNVIIERCDFEWCGGSVFTEGDTERDGNGIMLIQNFHDITIRYCTLKNIWEVGISLQEYGTTHRSQYNVYIHHNFITTTRGSGTELYVETSTPATLPDSVYWCHNVFYNIGGSVLATQEASTNSRAFNCNYISIPTNTHITNNIFHTCARWYMYFPNADLSGVTIDYNCYYPDKAESFRDPTTGSCDFADWKTRTQQDTHSTVSDPKLVDGAAGDFHVQTGSPCIDTGTDAGLNLPKLGSSWDMGAYEYPQTNFLKYVAIRKS